MILQLSFIKDKHLTVHFMSTGIKKGRKGGMK